MSLGMWHEATRQGLARRMVPRVVRARSGSFSVESLEGRALMCAAHDLVGGAALSATPASAVFDHNTALEAAPLPQSGIISLPSNSKLPASTAAPKHALSSLPDLSSLPGAPATLYLDFNGDYTAEWGGFHPGTTPAMDQDGDPTTFTDAELNTIHETWARVAEDYAPFNLNVTTDDPGNVADGKTLRVVVGGATSTTWYTSAVAGLGFVGSFTNDLPNTVYVFLNDNPSYMADIISHEAGHGFGLNHQEVYSSDGTLTDPYNDGDAISRPIMGGGGGRAVWWSGPSGAAGNIQDDISVIASPANGFGLRADDVSDSYASPAAMTLALDGQTRFASGIIGTSTDQDWFAFDTTGGNYTITADVAPQGANLDARLEFLDANGALIRTADSSTTLGESMNLTLVPGSYRIGVMSRHYDTSANPTRVGDVGAYSLKVQPHVRQPFLSTPFAVSATSATTIQAEDFDIGGQDVSYSDATPDINSGNVYRTTEGVDIKTTKDGSTAGFRIGDARPGEWLEYTINVPTSGVFTLDTRISNVSTGGAFHVEVDSNDVTGELAVPKTGSWSTYATVSKKGISLPAGQHVLRLAFDAGVNSDNAAGGFNWLRFTPTAAPVNAASTHLATSTTAYIRDGASSKKNFGGDSQLVAKLSSSSGSSRESYLKFDLSRIDVINTARLRLNGKLSGASVDGVQVGLYGSDNTTWSEKTLTWANQPASTDPMLSVVTVRGTSSKWYEWDVTEYLKAQKAAGHTMVTLVLKGIASTSPYATFNSDDASGSRPELQIT